MKISDIAKLLKKMSTPPEFGSQEHKDWLKQQDFLEFLGYQFEGQVVIAAICPHVFISSVLLPQRLAKKANATDLLNWEYSLDESWGYGYSFFPTGSPKSVFVSSPLQDSRSIVLRKAEPITYFRYFDGRVTNKNYLEVAHKITHMHDLHYVPERNAYCRYDEKGDIVDVVTIYLENHDNAFEDVWLVTMSQEVLDLHLFITKTVLTRVFDSTRFHPKSFSGWGDYKSVEILNDNEEIYASGGHQDSIGSFLRGFQFVRNKRRRKDNIALLTGKSEPKKYEQFLAFDWKNNKEGEYSCDPKQLGNYFERSDLPYETSPVFFNAEVLLRYKSDPDKYIVKDRSISCKHAWHLQTYDINDEGQVHTYLIYLSYLPYREQKYWRSFNEPSKAPISARAFKTDFEGDIYLDYDPLSSLKSLLHRVPSSLQRVYTMPSSDLLDELNYPATTAKKEWATEIHTLDKMVVDKLSKSKVRKIANMLGCEYDPEWGSIRLMEEVLRHQKLPVMEIDEVILPLKTVRVLRTKFSGHSTGSKSAIVFEEIITQHGDTRRHFRSMVSEIDKSLRRLTEIMERMSP